MGKKNFSSLDRLKKTAIDFDINDKLSNFREEFIIPENKIYLDGNSLGLLSKNTLSNLNTNKRRMGKRFNIKLE